jgi:Leucine-rich repeat (LRR) protein
MKTIVHSTRLFVASILMLTGLTATAQLQNITITDPGLDAAIRAALNKTNGPLTTADLLNLTSLEAQNRGITNVQGLELAGNLKALDLEDNNLTNFSFPGTLTNLTSLDLSFNALVQFSLPSGLTNLNELLLSGNQLTNITLPSGLTALSDLDLDANQLSFLVLPLDVTNLTFFFVFGNPLESLVVSEPIADGNLAGEAASLKIQNVSVLTFPLTPQLIAPQQTDTGLFEFVLTGPPGTYSILASSDLVSWTDLVNVTNEIGFARIVDDDSILIPQRFYRARATP